MSNLIRPVDLALLRTRLPAGLSSPSVGATLPKTGGPRNDLEPKMWAPPQVTKPSRARPTRQSIREEVLRNSAARDAARMKMAKEKGLRLDYTPTNLEIYVTSYNGALSGMLGG